MLTLINGSDRKTYSYLLNEYFRIRADVFAKRLGWDVSVANEQERDRFDEIDPLYLLSVDPVSGRVRGGMRVLPTTGPNMLRDVFPMLLEPGEVVENATTWEISRFAMDHTIEGPDAGRLISEVTGELMAGACEVGILAGISFYVAVFDTRFRRICRAAGCPPELIGRSQQIGVCMTHAGLFEASEAQLARIQRTCGIHQSVLEPQSAQRLFAA